ncbi:radical SAM family heme chaperone HemW [Metabacillus malikii]|uniref:Heme chaperone HemW n=1 Tax=Metabacillus malikii TaxID=1504265 RepID=A0ABT9ZH23_9BACI|nr:radical SAM family heme chaperone HemW [Metabacillus malikii]MDQ0231580.1 oxygen-independent coproporphyrinogen-3 oxidase [Metabacillus malikii]
MTKSAYVHIPFCHHICHYCDFNKVFFHNQPVDEYIELLIKEINSTFDKSKHDLLKTIFIGGGTPTALSAIQLDRLLEGMLEHLTPTSNLKEFAIEANPGELTADKLAVLKNAGVNRLSIGVQSFNDTLLQKIGRVHRAEDVFRTIQDAEKIGFDNMSLDLIYGLPGQTIEDFEETLKIALSLDMQHFSAYSLIVEPKTVFYNLMQKGKLSLPPQEQEAKMYELAMEAMEAKGYKQYEISNYAIPGFESEHNLTYWNNEEYYGFGAGAHGYLSGVRTSNIGPINKYMEEVRLTGQARFQQHEVSKKEQMEEEMFLGLRRTSGVNKKAFFNKFKKNLGYIYEEQLEKLEKLGLIENNEQEVKLTHKGKLLGNEVFQEFLM